MKIKNLIVFLSLSVNCLSSKLYGANALLLTQTQETFSQQSNVLDYPSAVTRTVGKSRTVKSAEYEIQVKQGGIEQAHLFPNPTFNYNIALPEDGWDQRQEIYSFTQLFEIWDKRKQRIEIANHEYYASLYGYEFSKLERLNRMGKAFIGLMSAQELLRISIDRYVTSEEFDKIAGEKLAAGKVSVLEKNKTEISLSLSEINLKKAYADFKIAKHSLSLVWSQSKLDFDLVHYPFYETSPPKKLEDHLQKICSHPEIIKSFYKSYAAYHTIQFEKAMRVPDVSLTLGYAWDTGSNELVAGISFPLPFWNHNQGNIKKAKYEMLKTENEAKQLWILLETLLSKTHADLARAYSEIQDLKDVLIKKANESFELAMEGYKEGKFEYLEVLEAKRTLFDIQERYIQSLATYHQKNLELEYLNSQIE